MKNAPQAVIIITGLLALTTLTGCSVADQLRNETASEFETSAALASGWGKSAPWLPDDASDITTRSAVEGDTAILRAISSSELDPAECAEVTRESAPVYQTDWSPNAFVDTAWVCDDWMVIPTDDGWFGWTPNDPDEQKQSPID